MATRYHELQSDLAELGEEAWGLQDENQTELIEWRQFEGFEEQAAARNEERLAHYQALIDAAKEDQATLNTKETQDNITEWQTFIDNAKPSEAGYEEANNEKEDEANVYRIKTDLIDSIRLLSNICKSPLRDVVYFATDIVLAGKAPPTGFEAYASTVTKSE